MPQELQLSVRLPATRKPIGLSLLVPDALTVVNGPEGSSFRAVETRAGKRVGEIDIAIMTPSLIMDRDGVLREAAVRAAESFVGPPRDGYLITMGEISLPGGVAWRADAYMQRGEDGHVPALPHQSIIAMGHPDFSLPVALFITVRSVDEEWPPGAEVLESLRFLGAPAASALEATVLPFTF